MIIAKINHLGVREIVLNSDGPVLFENFVIPLVRFELEQLDKKLKRRHRKEMAEIEKDERLDSRETT